MAVNFSTVSNTVTNTVAWVINQTVSAGRHIVQVGSHACSTVCPKLQQLASKVHTLNPGTVIHSVKTFARSDLGVGFGLLALGVACVAACDRPVKYETKTVVLTTIAVAAVLLSASIVLKPAGLSLTVFRA